jgi:hypothetical protein
MFITAAQTALAATGALGLTALDVGHREGQAPLGSQLRQGLHDSKSQILKESALMLGTTALLSKPVLSHIPGGNFIAKLVSPSVVTLAFAAGTAVDVVHKLHEAKAHEGDPAYHKTFMQAAIGSALESAGLVMIGVGMLPVVQGPVRWGLLGMGALTVGAGWPTSLGHGPLAKRIS